MTQQQIIDVTDIAPGQFFMLMECSKQGAVKENAIVIMHRSSNNPATFIQDAVIQTAEDGLSRFILAQNTPEAQEKYILRSVYEGDKVSLTLSGHTNLVDADIFVVTDAQSYMFEKLKEIVRKDREFSATTLMNYYGFVISIGEVGDVINWATSLSSMLKERDAQDVRKEVEPKGK